MTSTLLPFIEDGLRDLHEVVIESAFRCLINITRVTTTTTYDNTNTTKIVVFIIDSVVPFVLHPTTAIRNRSIEFLSLVLHKSDIGLARTVVLPKLVRWKFKNSKIHSKCCQNVVNYCTVYLVVIIVKKWFLFIHSSFIVFSIITAFKQTQTLPLTFLNYYNYICSMRRFFINTFFRHLF